VIYLLIFTLSETLSAGESSLEMSVVSQVIDFLGPRPGLAIIRVHQGKVEVVLRIAVIVSN